MDLDGSPARSFLYRGTPLKGQAAHSGAIAPNRGTKMPRVSANKESTARAVVGWRSKPWRESFEPPISKSQVALWIADGTLPSAKLGGGIRLITISPSEFVERSRA